MNFKIIINGATGVGKTTATHVLSKKYNCEYISSDNIRREMRSQFDERAFPFMFKSSYEVGIGSTESEILQNYLCQASIILKEVAGKLFLDNSILIFDGVHFNKDFLSSFKSNDYVVFFMKMPAIDEHIKRIKGEKFKGYDNIIKRSKYINNIRVIGAFLEKQWTLEAENNKNVFIIEDIKEMKQVLNRIL